MTERKKELKIPCTLVQDLLPLYIEQLTCAESDQLLREHLADCEVCQTQEALLRSTVTAALTEQQQEEKAEINYLKKLRQSGRKKLLFGLLTAAILLAVLCDTGLKLYVFGFNVDYELDSFFVQPMHDSTTAYTVHVQGHVTDKLYCRYKLASDDEGNDNLKIYARLPLPWESKEDVVKGSTFDFHINSSEVKGNLTTLDYYMGPHLTVLTAYDRQLFEAKNPYVGDMPANARLAGLLLDGEFLSGLENELQTDEEPYIWTLNFTQPLENSERFDYFERIMQKNACMLLALVDNLDEVRWTYIEKTKDGNVKHEKSMNTEQATFLNGTYIKDCADSPYEIHQLLLRITEALYDTEHTKP